jgi:hypothetical protein
MLLHIDGSKHRWHPPPSINAAPVLDASPSSPFDYEIHLSVRKWTCCIAQILWFQTLRCGPPDALSAGVPETHTEMEDREVLAT